MHTKGETVLYFFHMGPYSSHTFGSHWTSVFSPEVEIEVTGEDQNCDSDDGEEPPDDGEEPPDDGEEPPDDGEEPPDDGGGELKAGAYTTLPRTFVSVSHPTYDENARAVNQECEAYRSPEDVCVPAFPLLEGECTAEVIADADIGDGSSTLLAFFPIPYSETAEKAEQDAMQRCLSVQSTNFIMNCRIAVRGICGFGNRSE